VVFGFWSGGGGGVVRETSLEREIVMTRDEHVSASANLLFCRKMFARLGHLGRGEAALWDTVVQSPAQLEFFGVDSS